MKIIEVKSCFTCPYADTGTLCGMAVFCTKLDLQVTDSLYQSDSELPEDYINDLCPLQDKLENLHNT